MLERKKGKKKGKKWTWDEAEPPGGPTTGVCPTSGNGRDGKRKKKTKENPPKKRMGGVCILALLVFLDVLPGREKGGGVERAGCPCSAYSNRNQWPKRRKEERVVARVRAVPCLVREKERKRVRPQGMAAPSFLAVREEKGGRWRDLAASPYPSWREQWWGGRKKKKDNL